jgi:hypothetical protein
MEVIMSCHLCESSNEAELDAEMVIHFSGLKNLDNPGVWVFSKLLVCLDCGSSRFNVPETALASIAEGALARDSSKLANSAVGVVTGSGIAS